MRIEIERTDRRLYVITDRHLPQEAPVWEGITDDGRRVQCLVILVEQPKLLADECANSVPAQRIETPK